MIRCGWCNATIADLEWCPACGHMDPRLPWEQRGIAVPDERSEGRPALDEQDIRRRYAEARASLEREGIPPTVEALAERLDRSPRTVRDWRKRFSLR